MSQSNNQAPNPPSAAEPQPKPGSEKAKQSPPMPLPRKRADELEPVAPEPGGDTPVNPDQADG